MRPEDQPVSGRDQTATNVTHADSERRREVIEVFQRAYLLRNHREAGRDA